MGIKARFKNGAMPLLVDGGELTTSADATATANATFFVFPYSEVNTVKPIENVTPHPKWPALYCKTVTVKKSGLGALITATYEGADYTTEKADENSIEISTTMREEPIETHPDFEHWAGTPEKPNCGVFDDDGKFTGWNEKTPGGKIMRGVKSYLVPAYSATISYTSHSRPSLGGIGNIGGASGLPSIKGNYEWMNTGISSKTLADGKYQVTETYLSSGPKGWNKYIYK